MSLHVNLVVAFKLVQAITRPVLSGKRVANQKFEVIDLIRIKNINLEVGDEGMGQIDRC